MANSKFTNHILALAGSLMMLLTSCSTGIEGTRAIKMTRNEQREVQPGEEEVFISQLQSTALANWEVGKPFLISDNKASMIFEMLPSVISGGDTLCLAGDVIRYNGTITRRTPGGDEVLIIEFRDSTTKFRYNTLRKPTESMERITGLNIPMLIDLDMVAHADSMLKGKKLWTQTRLWYDKDKSIIDGRKFAPVTVEGVVPGNMLFPLRVEFTDSAGRRASMLMNVAQQQGNGTESRTFSSLFALNDPKLKYPSITDEHWALICDGRVDYGMTKDECRLALGNPSDIDTGHNWDYLVDIWGYKDGTYLQFRDGLLVGFRK